MDYAFYRLKQGCTSQAAINLWLRRKQRFELSKISKVKIIYNEDDLDTSTIVWYSDTGLIKVSLCNSLLNQLKSLDYRYIVTCGLLTHNKRPFKKGHYYCVLFDQLKKTFYVLNPHGYKTSDHPLELAISKTVCYSPEAPPTGTGPQVLYRYDKGYCGPWACLILSFIVKMEGNVNLAHYQVTKKINLQIHIERLLRAISEEFTKYRSTDDINGNPLKTVRFPTIKLSEEKQEVRLQVKPQGHNLPQITWKPSQRRIYSNKLNPSTYFRPTRKQTSISLVRRIYNR